ncbi:MAG: efflux RND transporter permease subunit, partial [Gemmatimonadaceae bacterium]
MFISDFAIRRPIITVVAMIALVVFGLFALMQLDTDEFPEIEPPIVSINIPYPGASPDQVEREVLEPIEEAVAGLSGVDKITSSALDSFATILVEFDFEKDVREASQEIRDEINAIRNDLPVEMEEPILVRFDPSALPIVSLALASTTVGAPELTLMADPHITRELRSITGVGDVVASLRMQNLAVPVGRITAENDERTIRLRGRVETVEDFRRIVIANRSGRLVRLGDVADVRIGTEEARTAAVYSGREAVGIDIVKAKGFSTTGVSDAVREKVAEIRTTLPAGVTLEMVRDAGTRVDNSVANVQEALLEGALLTVLTVFLFLNSWRSTVITGLALPVSVLAAFVAVWAWGFTLNTMSLLGLSLAIGILIDDAIVVRENIVRHMERGADRMSAARLGTAEIGLAVTATTFSIIAVFIPVAFMGGGAGEWFRPFALTVASSVLVSLFIPFTLDPMLSAYWGDPVGYAHQEKRGLSKILSRFNRWFDHQADRYGNVIAWALHHRRWMALMAVLTFVGALALQFTIGGSTFLPPSDYGTIAIDVRTPSSASLEYAKLKVEKGAELARTIPETKATNSTVNAGGGRVYVDIGKPKTRSRSSFEITAELRKIMKQLVGAEYVVIDDLNNGVRKPVQIQFYGPDSRRLMAITSDFMEKMKTIPGAVDVGLSEQEPKDELKIDLNRGLAN